MHPLLKKILDPPLLSFLILTNVPLVSSNQHWLLDALTASYGMVDSLSFMEVKMTTESISEDVVLGITYMRYTGMRSNRDGPKSVF